MTWSEGLGRYELLQMIGGGATAVVHKARDLELRRLVAIKTLRRDGPALLGADEPAGPARLQHEALAGARLSHPGIVAIHDVVLAGDVPHVVMEYVEGCTLAEMLVTGPLPVEPAVRLVLDVCRALEYAHAQGVVHRDVKSSNILVGPSGAAKLADFGIAWIADPHATLTTGVVGTPAYMAPEQLRGRGADPRSDLFSLAVVLYESVTGCKPFPGEDLATVLYGIAHDDPVPASHHNSAVSPALDAVIRRALSKEPEARYPDARALAGALRDTLADLVAGAPAGPAPRPPARRWRPWAGAAAATVLVVACTGLVMGIDRGVPGWTPPSPPRMPAMIPGARAGAANAVAPPARTGATRRVAVVAPGGAVSAGGAGGSPVLAGTTTSSRGVPATGSPATPAEAARRGASPARDAWPLRGAGLESSRERETEAGAPREAPPAGGAAARMAAGREIGAARETGAARDAGGLREPVGTIAAPVAARAGEPALGAAEPRPDTVYGCLSVNAVPFAAVFVDGRHVGDTPRACVRVRAGSHQVHFESPAGRSPERAIVVTSQHTADSPLAVSYDFAGRRFLGP